MAREHWSWPGQSAAMVTSMIEGIAMTPPNPVRNIVTKRWLKPAKPSIPKPRPKKMKNTNQDSNFSCTKECPILTHVYVVVIYFVGCVVSCRKL